jgi:hypothetical protein
MKEGNSMNKFMNVLGILLILGSGEVLAQNILPANGNVGIGTTTPRTALEVNGSSQGSVQIDDNTFDGAGLVITGPPGAWVTGGIQLKNSSTGSFWNLIQNGALNSPIDGFSVQYWSGTAWVLPFEISGTGNVGIGTTTPGAKLEVDGNLKFTSGSGASVTYADGTVQSTAWNGTTLGGDYAESIDVLGDRAGYEPGDVIVIDDSVTGKFDKSDKAYSKLVAGVYSTKPGLVGRRTTAERPDKAAEVPMAMMGIVPTKVTTENGAIERGDLLVSSSKPGYAMKGTDRDRLTGAVIGKALAPLKSGSGVIEVLLALQ